MPRIFDISAKKCDAQSAQLPCGKGRHFRQRQHLCPPKEKRADGAARCLAVAGASDLWKLQPLFVGNAGVGR